MGLIRPGMVQIVGEKNNYEIMELIVRGRSYEKTCPSRLNNLKEFMGPYDEN